MILEDKYLAIWNERKGEYTWFVRERGYPCAVKIKIPGTKEKIYHATGRFIAKDGLSAEIFEADGGTSKEMANSVYEARRFRKRSGNRVKESACRLAYEARLPHEVRNTTTWRLWEVAWNQALMWADNAIRSGVSLESWEEEERQKGTPESKNNSIENPVSE